MGHMLERWKLIAILLAAPALFTVRHALAAEPPTSEAMLLDFERACAAVATDQELSGPGVTLPRSNPKHPFILATYPEESPRAREQGTVLLLVLVNEGGYVVQAKVSKSSGSTALDRASLESSRDWRLVPGTINGKAKCMWMPLAVTWKLTD